MVAPNATESIRCAGLGGFSVASFVVKSSDIPGSDSLEALPVKRLFFMLS